MDAIIRIKLLRKNTLYPGIIWSVSGGRSEKVVNDQEEDVVDEIPSEIITYQLYDVPSESPNQDTEADPTGHHPDQTHQRLKLGLRLLQ